MLSEIVCCHCQPIPSIIFLVEPVQVSLRHLVDQYKECIYSSHCAVIAEHSYCVIHVTSCTWLPSNFICYKWYTLGTDCKVNWAAMCVRIVNACWWCIWLPYLLAIGIVNTVDHHADIFQCRAGIASAGSTILCNFSDRLHARCPLCISTELTCCHQIYTTDTFDQTKQYNWVRTCLNRPSASSCSNCTTLHVTEFAKTSLKAFPVVFTW